MAGHQGIPQRPGPSPVSREQSFVRTPQEAAAKVRIELGHHAPQLERAASWRLRPASIHQQKTWSRLNPNTIQDPGELTSGEIWDDISRQRFENRVNPKLL